MRPFMLAMLVAVATGPAWAQDPDGSPPAAAAPAAAPVAVPLDPALVAAAAAGAAAVANTLAKEELEALIKAQAHGPDPDVVDPGRDAREQAWVARCKPRLVDAADGMKRYVYAFRDCEGGELTR